MFFRSRSTVMFGALMSLAALVAPVAAAECPAQGLKDISTVLERAPSCERASALFVDCAFGASGDVPLSQIVIQKCEANFLTTLSAAQKQDYDRQRAQCVRKYQSQSGTLARSEEAFCVADVAKAFATRFAPGRKP